MLQELQKFERNATATKTKNLKRKEKNIATPAKASAKFYKLLQNA